MKEYAPQGSKGSNGRACGQSVEQCFRTLKAPLDDRTGVKIDVLHPALTGL